MNDFYRRVFVYWNLHRKCWSVRMVTGPDKGRVKYHAAFVVLRDCAFKVSEAGRQRVLRGKRKNVHAGVEGTLIEVQITEPENDNSFFIDDVAINGIPVGYNPYKGPAFYEKLSGHENPVHGARRVAMRADRRVLVQEPKPARM